MKNMQIQKIMLYKTVHDNSEINQTEGEEFDSIEDNVPEMKHKCDLCKYECEKEITLRKHKTTKHMNMNHKENNEDDQKTTKTKCTQL